MGSVITFAQQKGGAGKTTLLACIAHQLHLDGARVALADLDPQGSLTHWHGMGRMPGLTLIDTASYRVGGDLRDARAKFDFVLVDCPGSATSLLEAALRESDLVLVPCQTSQVDVWATAAILHMCDSENATAHVVLNRVAPRGKATDTTRTALEMAGAQVMATQIGNRVAFAHGMAAGTTVLGLTGQVAAKQEIAALTREMRAVLT